VVARDGRPGGRVLGANEERPDPKRDTDPRTMWQDALARGVDNPGLIIAVADFLVLNRKFDHAVEFLKANLRQGILVRPWVYDSLALALRESGGSAEEIERAEVAAADLEPQDAQSFLRAASAMQGHKRYDRAVAFARQAALLEPNAPYAYTEGLVYAELAQDPKAMEWAAGNLVGKDWPARDKELKARAQQKLDALAATLARADAGQAQRLREAVASQKQRDLVIRLAWQGEADLDLMVKEPSGSVCSTLNRQTVGGGIFVGDSLEDMTNESYLAALAFGGTYEVTVRRVWGKPLGDKAQLTVIRHQGTPEQTEELVTVNLKESKPLTVTLAGGRRKETAYVPPPARQDASELSATATGGSDKVVNQLRALADPELSGTVRAMRGGNYGPGMAAPSARTLPTSEAGPGDRVLHQTKVDSFVRNSMDVTAQAVLAADRRSVRVSVTPVFNTVALAGRPTVTNPSIPGAGR